MPLTDPAVLLTLRVALALVFALSVAGKLWAPEAFVSAVREYRLVPGFAVRMAAYAVMVGEAAIVLAVLPVPTSRWAAAGALALLAVFTVAISVNLARGRREIDCGCFGPVLRQPLSAWLLARNGALMAVAAACLAAGPPGRPLNGLDLFTGVAAGAALAALHLSANHLLSRPAARTT